MAINNNKSIFFVILILILFLDLNFYGKHRRKLLWVGRAETYGASDIRLIIDMVNDCHFRMRYYYYLGAAPPSVMFGRYKLRKNFLILIDGEGHKVKFFKNGIYMVGYDNGYRIFIKRIR